MTTKSAGKVSGGKGEHASVSNIGAAEAVGPPQSVPPHAGEAGGAAPAPRDDGSEAVPGFKLPDRSASEVLAETAAGLRDIGEASFGGGRAPGEPQTETVHGVDDRVQIANTTGIPWRQIASLLITARDGSSWIGTGWFIGPHTLATAGHVVYIKNSGVPGRDGWVRSVRVIPGRNGSAMPFGSAISTAFRSVTGWTNSGNEEFDYGAIILPNNDLGNRVGWFGFGVYGDADLLSAVANVSGYPGDKPDGTQWFGARRIASVGPRKVHYDIDTAGGQSGAPVYRIVGGGRIGIAVHAYGGPSTNSGTRINTEVYNNLVAWKA